MAEKRRSFYGLRKQLQLWQKSWSKYAEVTAYISLIKGESDALPIKTHVAVCL